MIFAISEAPGGCEALSDHRNMYGSFRQKMPAKDVKVINPTQSAEPTRQQTSTALSRNGSRLSIPWLTTPLPLKLPFRVDSVYESQGDCAKSVVYLKGLTGRRQVSCV